MLQGFGNVEPPLPVQTLQGAVDPLEWAQGTGIALGWCVVVLGIGRAVWRRGYREYSGVGI